MSLTYPTPITIPPLNGQPATATIIVLHGLGDSGAGWAFLAPQYQSRFPYAKFIFPSAPSIPITINGGYRMPGWHDITSLNDINSSEDEQGVGKSREYVHNLIAEEVKSGVSSDRIVLGGFSQGGAMALHAGLTCPTKLGGIFALSAYLLLRNTMQDLIKASGDTNRGTKIFQAHGQVDPTVQFQFGEMTAETLKRWGYEVDFRRYPGLGHSADERELEDLAKYLESAVPATVAETKKGENL